MATIHILKKTGDEVKLIVGEDAECIFFMINGEDGEGSYQRHKFIDSILLTLANGKKMGINPRFIAYYHD